MTIILIVSLKSCINTERLIVCVISGWEILLHLKNIVRNTGIKFYVLNSRLT